MHADTHVSIHILAYFPVLGKEGGITIQSVCGFLYSPHFKWLTCIDEYGMDVL
jgi:hypothetical protein